METPLKWTVESFRAMIAQIKLDSHVATANHFLETLVLPEERLTHQRYVPNQYPQQLRALEPVIGEKITLTICDEIVALYVYTLYLWIEYLHFDTGGLLQHADDTTRSILKTCWFTQRVYFATRANARFFSAVEALMHRMHKLEQRSAYTKGEILLFYLIFESSFPNETIQTRIQPLVVARLNEHDPLPEPPGWTLPDLF